MICNVHGVNPKFLEVGERIASEMESGQQSMSKGAYFLGKMVWAKGYRELIDLLAKHKTDLEGFKLDVYGNGEDSLEVQSAAKKLDLNLNFHRGRDHADDSLHGYRPEPNLLIMRIYAFYIFDVIDLNASPVLFPGTKFS